MYVYDISITVNLRQKNAFSLMRKLSVIEYDGIQLFFTLMKLQPLRYTLFPYTTLFRSHAPGLRAHGRGRDDHDRRRSPARGVRSEEHTSELQSRQYIVCRLLLEKKKIIFYTKLD